MSFNIEAFIAEPSIKALLPLKRTELTQLAEHFKLSVASGAKKGEIRQLIINHLRKEELVSDEELEETSATALQRLEERANEREAELKVKELQLREKELEVQLRMRELASY